MDIHQFFREATLRICGNLEITDGLRACIEYLSEFMPADRLYLTQFSESYSAYRVFAHATREKGQYSDLMFSLSEPDKKAAAKVIESMKQGDMPLTFKRNAPITNPFSVSILNMLRHPGASVLSTSLIIDGQVAGALNLISEDGTPYTDSHVELFDQLRTPFFIAMSNMLKHHEIVALKDMLLDDNRYLHSELRRLSGDEIVGANFGLRDVMEKTYQVARLDSPVLLLGETGVGKDVIANAIHYTSGRREGPFVSVNCGAIPESLIDSELFGHEKGAFTGAVAQKRGRFERAENGTIFLDEIGELPPQAQVRLLRVLQNKEIERVGGDSAIRLNIRVIAATNRNLEQMVKEGTFREDLWFRLNVFPIHIPPLRQRKSDIPALLQHFISQKSRELKLSRIPDIMPGAIEVLMNYRWPGNIRELQNVVERALILNPGGPLNFNNLASSSDNPEPPTAEAPNGFATLDAMVKSHIEAALIHCEGKIHGRSGAAQLLGINGNTLRNRMDKLGIAYKRASKTSSDGNSAFQ